MTAMKFLATFDGNVNCQDSGTTGTLTNDGAQTYATSYWAGHQALVLPESLSLASAVNAGNPATGSVIIRFKAPNSFAYTAMFGIGTSPTSPRMNLRVSSAAHFEFEGSTGTAFTATDPTTLTAATSYFGYADWGPSAIHVAVGTNALTTVTRSAAAYFPTAGVLHLGVGDGENAAMGSGQLSGITIFDAPLTDAQRTYLAGLTTPWTWGMALSAPIAGYIDVLPSAGANTGAPVLTLP